MAARAVVVDQASVMQYYDGASEVVSITFENKSSINYIFKNKSDYTLHNQADVFVIPSRSSIEVQVKTVQTLAEFSISFEVLNAVKAPRTHPVIQYSFVVSEWEVQVPSELEVAP